MVVGLGGSVVVELAPFEPEAAHINRKRAQGITIIMMITNMVTVMIIRMLTLMQPVQRPSCRCMALPKTS